MFHITCKIGYTVYTIKPVQEECLMSEQKKKISLQEAIKEQLANKKGQGSAGKLNTGPVQTQKMKSQLPKKPNNQHRRTGV